MKSILGIVFLKLTRGILHLYTIYTTMVGENFEIYSSQVAKKYTYFAVCFP